MLKFASESSRIMKAPFLASIFFLTLISANGQVQLALNGPEWKETTAFEVKGRQGILIKQKLHFGTYFTTSVVRSWTKGQSSFRNNGKGTGSQFRKMISTEYEERNQTMFFTFGDSAQHKADVHCVTNFRLQDINVGNTGISIPRIMGSMPASDVFYAQIYTTEDGAPWHLVIDNQASQDQPKTYTTRLAKSSEEFYTLSPHRLVKNNKGKVTEMTFGSAGFQIRNRRGEPVAAVCLINKGVVYLKPLPADERFLLAAACAAMLLQEQISPE